MEAIDEKLIDEKFKNVYTLFDNKLDVISAKLDEVIKRQDIANGRVTKLETNQLLVSRDYKALSKTLKELSVTLSTINEKTDKIEEKQNKDEEEHIEIKSKLHTVEELIKNAQKKGIKFWLWFSENKARILIILIIIYVFALPALQDLFMELFFKVIGKF